MDVGQDSRWNVTLNPLGGWQHIVPHDQAEGDSTQEQEIWPYLRHTHTKMNKQKINTTDTKKIMGEKNLRSTVIGCMAGYTVYYEVHGFRMNQ